MRRSRRIWITAAKAISDRTRILSCDWFSQKQLDIKAEIPIVDPRSRELTERTV